MAREARFREPEVPYHITQRGNYRQDVFASDNDKCYISRPALVVNLSAKRS